MVVVLAVAIFSASFGLVSFAQELPKGPGAELVYKKCQTCHDIQYVIDSKGISRKQWHSIIQEMKSNGLQITPEEEKRLLDYLSNYMGPESSKK